MKERRRERCVLHTADGFRAARSMATAPPRELPNNIFRIECGVSFNSFKVNASGFLSLTVGFVASSVSDLT
jgi:hypothetical protein